VRNTEPSTVYWLSNSLYLNITNKCSNNCWFCLRNFKRGVADFNLRLATDPDSETVIASLKKILPTRRWSEAVFCGFGEPTSRFDVMLQVTRWLNKNLSTLPIRLNTNGHGYALNKGRDVAKELKIAGITFASVSLNGHDEQTYSENCRPSFGSAFKTVQDFVRRAKQEFSVELTAVRMPEVDVGKVKAIAEDLGVPFRTREYIPCFW
jgi:cyclic pyranopterin phosphate synthase